MIDKVIKIEKGETMKLKKIIYTILLIIWMVVIFLFSNQNAAKSESISDKVTSGVIDIAETITNQEVKNEKRSTLIEETRFFIRKSAHFTLYFILGILTYLTFSSYSIKNPILYSISFCFLYAGSDEIHQIFSDGRTAKLLDVFIDTIGASIGILLILLVKKKTKIRL